MAPRRPAVGDTVAHARFAQSGAVFGRHPTPDPTVAYGDEHPARLTGDEPFDAADVLEPALTLTGLPGGVVPGGLVVSQADDGDAAQRHVALPVAAFIEPVPARPATGRGQRACAAELGERGLAPDAFGVIAGDDGQCVLMLLYIVKRLGVLFWVGCRVYPLDGPLLEFGKVACAAFDLADAARGHAERLADLLLGDVPADA